MVENAQTLLSSAKMEKCSHSSQICRCTIHNDSANTGKFITNCCDDVGM